MSNETHDDPADEIDEADEANGEGRPDEKATNDTEQRYGADESPA